MLKNGNQRFPEKSCASCASMLKIPVNYPCRLPIWIRGRPIPDPALPRSPMPRLDILVLTAYPPALGLHGGGLRMYYNVKFLASRHRVTLISFIEHERERELLEKLEPLGVEVRAVPRRPAPVRHLWIPRPAEHYEFAGRGHGRRGPAGAPEPALRRHAGRVSPDGPARSPGRRPAHRAHHCTRCSSPMRFKRSRRPATPGPGPAGGTTGWLQLNYEVRTCARFDAVVCMTGEGRPAVGRVRPLLQAADHPHRGGQPLLPGRVG